MDTIQGTKVLLGVTGGIAAYKSADLARRLSERGFELRVVMTRGACEFITPLTLQAVSAHPVRRDLFDERSEAAMGHIELARWADLVLIAPASADFLAKLAHGIADDLLSTLCLATATRIVVAPSMNQQMWAARATQDNKRVLLRRGVRILGPAAGSQACGEVGLGRMAEPPEIADRLVALCGLGPLANISVLVTAGPTREAIDPVRYLSNHSSGKMGYAVAEAAADAGAAVTLVSGPTALDPPSGVDEVQVVTAEEMYEGVMSRIAAHDIFIGAAAVADYRPTRAEAHKIKKLGAELSVAMRRTKDILADVAALPRRPFTVGFAAETQDLLGNAMAKLEAKSLDLIAANEVGAAAGGFGADDNALKLLWEGGSLDLPLAPKSEIARALIEVVAQRYHAKRSAQAPR